MNLALQSSNFIKFADIQIIFGLLWALLIVGCIAYFVSYPAHFKPETIASFLSNSYHSIWPIYLAISILRGFTLLPSTPLVIAGTLLFPSHPWMVLAISISGIVLSSTLIYYFSDLLGFDEFFESRKPRFVEKVRARLEHPAGIAFVFLWAFFPLVPTDAVCYVAGSSRMNFAKFITAITAGELILCSFYIFSGSYLIDMFR